MGFLGRSMQTERQAGSVHVWSVQPRRIQSVIPWEIFWQTPLDQQTEPISQQVEWPVVALLQPGWGS